MWYWRRMEKNISTDRVKKMSIITLSEKEDRNIPREMKRRKANLIRHILRRNCLIKHVTEEKIKGRVEVTGRQGRRCKQLLHDLKERRGYWKLKMAY